MVINVGGNSSIQRAANYRLLRNEGIQRSSSEPSDSDVPGPSTKPSVTSVIGGRVIEPDAPPIPARRHKTTSATRELRPPPVPTHRPGAATSRHHHPRPNLNTSNDNSRSRITSVVDGDLLARFEDLRPSPVPASVAESVASDTTPASPRPAQRPAQLTLLPISTVAAAIAAATSPEPSDSEATDSELPPPVPAHAPGAKTVRPAPTRAPPPVPPHKTISGRGHKVKPSVPKHGGLGGCDPRSSFTSSGGDASASEHDFEKLTKNLNYNQLVEYFGNLKESSAWNLWIREIYDNFVWISLKFIEIYGNLLKFTEILRRLTKSARKWNNKSKETRKSVKITFEFQSKSAIFSNYVYSQLVLCLYYHSVYVYDYDHVSLSIIRFSLNVIDHKPTRRSCLELILGLEVNDKCPPFISFQDIFWFFLYKLWNSNIELFLKHNVQRSKLT